MSKINSFLLVIIVALSLSSCSDKSKALQNTWRVDNVKFNKPIPPQMQAYIQSQIDFMKSSARTTYNADGTFDDVQGPKSSKGHWDLSKDAKVLYSTDESGKTARYLISELSKDKFTYLLVPAGPTDTLTFYMVPFAAKDTLNKKPIPQMHPQPQQEQQPQGNDQQPQGNGQGQPQDGQQPQGNGQAAPTGGK
jgi:hypothetical protein